MHYKNKIPLYYLLSFVRDFLFKSNYQKIVFLISFFLYSCAPKPFYKDKSLLKELQDYKNQENIKPVHTFYFIGDAGKGNDSSAVFQMLKSFLSKENSQSQFSTIFLGDNIYNYGLPEEGSKDYAEAKKRLDAQINAVKKFNGNVIFIPGNHDWALDGKEGWNAVKRQQKYIENQLGIHSFFPKNGCPGPVEVMVNNEFVLIVYDSQWWIHPHQKPDSIQCDYGSKKLFLEAMNNVLEKHKEKTIIVAAHHPFFSCSSHGGRFTLKEHIFPLRFLNSNLYIPLPIIGTGLVLLRFLAKHPSDSWNPKYKELKKELLPIFEKYPNLIYVSGHDHNLQYRKEKQVHHVISGSGTKISEVGKSKKWEFTYSNYGLSILKVYPNKKIDLEFWVIQKKNPEGQLVYKKTIIP